MAGNYGKYIDRAPIICAAGKVSGDPSENVTSALKQYRVVDEIDSLKHDAGIWKEDQFVPPRKLPPIQNAHFKGLNTEIREALRPPVMTRYQQLIMDLKETPYTSYWNAQLGKGADPTPGLPAGMDPVHTTFGQPTNRGIPLKELVNPSKSYYEVLKESQIGHEMYKKTHNDYNPSEKVDRSYKQPPYCPKKCFGITTKYDPRGIWVKCACDWFKIDNLVPSNKVQADYFKRSRHQVGKVLAPNDNINCVPKDHVFGDPSKQDFYGVEDLLKDPNVKPCVFKRDFHQWLASLNKTRLLIKEKRVHGLNLEELYKRALYYDKEKSGMLPVDELYRMFANNHVFLPKDLEYLYDHLNYIANGNIDYRKFIDLLDINKDPTDIRPIDDIPPRSKYYTSTSQAANCDHLFINNIDMPVAGVPSVRHDLPRPIAPSGRSRADIENFGDETSVKALVNPSVYTSFGLTYRDFFMPRSAEVIRRLFEKLGYNFPRDNFQKLWKMGTDLDQTEDKVCVDTFKRLLQTQCPSLRLRVDEKQIECEKRDLK